MPSQIKHANILRDNWSYSFDGSEQHSGKQLWTLNWI